MQNKFQYIILGVGITLLTILGVMSLAFSRAEAKVNSDVTNSGIMLQQPESPEVNNLNQGQEQTQTSQLQMGSSLSPETADTEEAEVVLASAEPLIEEVEVVSANDVGATDDRKVIVDTVAAFASKQEENLFGKSGWIYERYIMATFLPGGQEKQEYHLTTGETIPMELLAPNSSILESWYHVDGDNTFFEGVSLVLAMDETIRQKSVLIGEDWVNLTLKEANADSGQYATRRASNVVMLGTRYALETLAKASTAARIEAVWENGQYVVTLAYYYEEPLEHVVNMPEPVIGSKMVYTFDMKSGGIISSEGYTLLQSNNWHHGFSQIYSPVEYQSELPAEARNIFNEAVGDYMEEQ